MRNNKKKMGAAGWVVASMFTVGVVGSQLGWYETPAAHVHRPTPPFEWRPDIPDQYVGPENNWDVDTGSDQPRIEEDDPRWDCVTMGNRICGPGH